MLRAGVQARTHVWRRVYSKLCRLQLAPRPGVVRHRSLCGVTSRGRCAAVSHWSDVDEDSGIYLGRLSVDRGDSSNVHVSPAAVGNLVRAFRTYGHAVAQLDPLELTEFPTRFDSSFGALFRSMDAHEDNDGRLDFGGFIGLEFADQTARFQTAELIDADLRDEWWTLPELARFLRSTYAASVGVEYDHISNHLHKRWLRRNLETADTYVVDEDTRRAMLAQIISVQQFEAVLADNFPSAKRFGVDGCESLIPLLQELVHTARHLGVTQVEMGMAHRGRLSVLAHVMQKPFGQIFHEFGTRQSDMNVGDVKYHLGASTKVEVPGRNGEPSEVLRMNLAANPSHLEIVDAVVMGQVRAAQHFDADGTAGTLGVVVHGDASFSGQGIVAETLQLSNLSPYTVGGMCHIILNNQIGFTTSPHLSRSSPHPSDFAKALGAPIFHVNADDPDAVAAVARIAAKWRQHTRQSVVIDLVGYRRLGHNEQDNPMFTHPQMYRRIASMVPVRVKYQERLLQGGVVTEQCVAAMERDSMAVLREHHERESEFQATWLEWFVSSWQADALKGQLPRQRDTGVPAELLAKVGQLGCSVPDGFSVHKALQAVLRDREKAARGAGKINWGTAEMLAFGSLLAQDCHIRLCGQDSQRGTFNQRHAVLHDQVTGESFTPLSTVNPASVRDVPNVPFLRQHRYEQLFTVSNSSLSEAAALAFEYGYSLASPNSLTLWEAQFGDFANVAASVIDTYIATGEDRWQLKTNLTVLLPHGFEGQGPDHSSARPERFLQLCNSDADLIPGISSADVASIDKGFDAVDTHNRGELNLVEVMEAVSLIQAQGQTAMHGAPMSFDAAMSSEAWARDLIDEIDVNGSGKLSKREWREFMRRFRRNNTGRMNNLLVLSPSTPAQYFHALRLQAMRSYAKPAVIFTPKSKLHHGPCRSPLEDFLPGSSFQLVLPHVRQAGDVDDAGVRRVILCTGQVYWNLIKARKAAKAHDVVVVRLERLSPFPFEELAQATVRQFPNAELVWVQEEPRNMGCWAHVNPRVHTMVRTFDPARVQAAMRQYDTLQAIVAAGEECGRVIRYVGRPPASSATGSFHVHQAETQRYVLGPAFA